MGRPERPDEDADASEIARWMAEDFSRAVAKGIARADEEGEEDGLDDGSK